MTAAVAERFSVTRLGERWAALLEELGSSGRPSLSSKAPEAQASSAA